MSEEVKKPRTWAEKSKYPVRPWTREDIEFLKAAYMYFSDRELEPILQRGWKTIEQQRRKLGLMKMEKQEQIKKLKQRVPIVFIFSKDEFEENRNSIFEFLNLNEE